MTEPTTAFLNEAPVSAVKRATKRKTAPAAEVSTASQVANVAVGAPASPARKPRAKRSATDEDVHAPQADVRPEPTTAKRGARARVAQEPEQEAKQTPKRALRTKNATSKESPLPNSEPAAIPVPEPAPAAPKARRKKASEDAERTLVISEQEPPVESEKTKPRARQKRSSTPSLETVAPRAENPAPESGHASAGSHAPVSPHQPAPSTGDAGRKPYPVYVPLHVAKQMEQEGKPAPLAVAPDAVQAAEIRAASHASYENRHAGGPSPAPTSVQAPARDEQRGQHPDRASEPADRRDRNQHPRNDRNDRRQGGRPQDRGADRPERNDRPDRGERNDHQRREGKRGRHDRRRDGRSEDSQGRQGEDRSHGDPSREHSRELPPPTPEELYEGEGIIEISGKGFGFLRDRARNFVQSKADIFVSPEMVRRFNLRDGQWIKGSVRKSGLGQQMHEIQSVNGDAPEASKMQPMFEELTVINPSEPLWMATTPERYTTRIIDMVAPIGKGQRGLIVAPPRTGKTTLLQHIADAMMKNHPDVKLIMLLVDERPEEVTEIRHTVPKAEIMASSNDMEVRSHTRIAELAIERAKRLVEAGQDVFILLDSITRLGRAFNNAMTNGGRTMSGGIDARAMEIPRKLFAAARNTEEAGSLTIIATALIETGSRMDEIIFQEFKGTGNMELVLDRKIAEQRIYPAVDIFQSGTRREELLVPADTLQKIHFLRRGLSGCRPSDAIDRLLFYLKKFQTNEQMLREIRG